jgi:endonuclease V-like protein UPF0215 family
VPSAFARNPEIVEGVSVARIKLDRGRELADGVIEVLERQVDRAQVVMRDSVMRL